MDKPRDEANAVADLVERLSRREHHYRHAVEGEYDANLLMKARFAIEAQATRLAQLEQENARLRAEMERRDRNENRNCLNWGPCSRNDGRMRDGAHLSKGADNAE